MDNEKELEINDKETDAAKEAVESLAKKMGWNPNHADGESGRPFVDAESFILRSNEIQDTMRKQLKSNNDKIATLADQLDSGIRSLKEHQERVFSAEKERLESEINDLKSQRRQAIKDGEADLVDSIDDKIDIAKKRIPVTKPTDTPQKSTGSIQPDPAFVLWLGKNPWYKKEKAMTAFADSLASEFKGVPYTELLPVVDKQMREQFPLYFKEDRPSFTSGDDPTRTHSSKNKKFTAKDLTFEQRKSMDKFVKMGALTEEQYVEDLVKSGELS